MCTYTYTYIYIYIYIKGVCKSIFAWNSAQYVEDLKEFENDMLKMI